MEDAKSNQMQFRRAVMQFSIKSLPELLINKNAQDYKQNIEVAST
jgi:hypothetical protein